MAFQPCPAVEVVIRGGLDADLDMVNVYHWPLDFGAGPHTQGLADILSEALYDAYVLLQGFYSTSTTWVDVITTDLRTEGAPQFTSQSGGFPITGTDATNPMPNEVAALVSWNTALRGKSFRGRTYLSGFCEDGSAGNSPTGGLTAVLTSFAAAIVTPDAPATAFCVLSRVHNKVQRATGVTNLITGSKVSPLWCSQRGRRPGL